MVDTELTHGLWEGRSWLKLKNLALPTTSTSSVRFLSYNTFPDCKSTFINHSINTQWELRSQTQLNEIKSYNADIMCLQDIDHFKDFWRPKLMLLGYESLFKVRTQLKDYHYEGVIIAFKSQLFQLFKSVPVEFNDAVNDLERGSSFLDRSKTDDVGLILFLQPMRSDYIASALCVGCAMFSENDRNADIRMAHSQYFALQIELANKEFHLPVLLGVNLNDTPASLAYNLLVTGRTPLSAQVPAKCKTPFGEVFCRGSVLLRWLPPPTNLADLPILSYVVAWRPGGSRTLGFSAQQDVSIGDCVKYGEQRDEKGVKRMVALPHRQFVVSGLVSDLPFEFRVCALNQMGQGIWSDLSDPVLMKNPDKAPPLPALVNFSNLPELTETREFLRMAKDDWDVNSAFDSNPMLSRTQLTPRDMDGRILHIPRSRVLPIHTNPRDGWKESLKGTRDVALVAELSRESVVANSILRDRDGFINSEFNRFDDGLGQQAMMVENGRTDVVAVTDLECGALINRPEDSSMALLSLDSLLQSTQMLTAYPPDQQQQPQTDEVLLDCKEVLHSIGTVNPRQVHDLGLSSAYCAYSCGGEPMFTASAPREKYRLGVDCMDYILYSSASLVPTQVLSLPLLTELQRLGESPRETVTTVDHKWDRPFPCALSSFNDTDKKLHLGVDSGLVSRDEGSAEGRSHAPVAVSQYKVNETKRLLKTLLLKSETAGNNPVTVPITTTIPSKSNSRSNKPTDKNLETEFVSTLWGGGWTAFPQANHTRTNGYLPNERFSSTHIAICAEFVVDNNALSTQWW